MKKAVMRHGLLVVLFLTMVFAFSNVQTVRADGGVEINETNFPDKVFREYVGEFDINYDGSLSDGEIGAVTTIFVNKKGISDLTGIEHFTALEYLSCYDNQLTSLDVSENTALKMLNCRSNQLTSLDVSKNAGLETLECWDNQLTGLDVSKNTRLIGLDCSGNQLTSLDVSKNTALKGLHCSLNQLKNLDVSKNTALEDLICTYTRLTSLNVSKNTRLIGLDCSGNQLTSLDVSKNAGLETLECWDNQLTGLDVSKNTTLKRLDCSGNQLTSLDVSKNTALKGLRCYGNQLKNLDVSKNTALEDLNCNSNRLTSLNVSKNTALKMLNCRSNQLTSLDVSKNTALKGLDCSWNQLTSLDVSKNTTLKELNCSGNQLKNLDVSKNTALEDLNCNSTRLTSLNVSKNTALKGLDCSWNRLTSLDVSKNTKLDTLFCDYNYFSSVDISGLKLERHSGTIKGNTLYVKARPPLTKSISDAVVTGVAGKSYTGKAITQNPTVKVDGVTLKKDTDYTLSYKNNVNAGTATMIIIGKGNYSGTKSVNFTISLSAAQAKNMKYATVTGVADRTYTGKAVTQAITVKLGNTSLKNKKDYTITYKNNKKVGTATVTIKGKGKIKGSKTLTFKINKADNPLKVTGKTAPLKAKNLNKKNQTIAVSKVIKVTKKGQGKVTYAKADGDSRITINKSGKVTVKKGTPAGTYLIKAKVTAAGNSNYNKNTIPVTFTVKVQ